MVPAINSGIDSAAMEEYLKEGGAPWFNECCEKAIEDNPDLDLPRRLIIFPMVQDGVFMVNGGTGAYGYDGTKGEDRTKLTLWGRQRAKLLTEFLFRNYIPGGENCRLRLTAYYPGVRETRRIVGETTLTEELILSDACLEDTIAIAGRHFDLSRQAGNGLKQPFGERSLPHGAAGIPYGALIPKDSENIIVTGRCIAADGQALGPARIMSTCMAVGEAAGKAAIFKIQEEKKFIEVDVKELRNRLRDNGAIVDL